MSKTFTLDNFRDAAEAKYGSLPIEHEGETFSLRNVLRLPSADRKAISSAQDDVKGEDGEDADEDKALESLRKIVRIAADKKKPADKFLEAVGEDAGILMVIIEQYMEDTQVGEASPSQD